MHKREQNKGDESLTRKEWIPNYNNVSVSINVIIDLEYFDLLWEMPSPEIQLQGLV